MTETLVLTELELTICRDALNGFAPNDTKLTDAIDDLKDRFSNAIRKVKTRKRCVEAQ